MGIIKSEPATTPTGNTAPHTVLGPDSSFDGKLTFTGAVRIDGKFKGEIHTNDILVIGDKAEVDAGLFVGSLVLNGMLKGNVNAKSIVELTPSARLYGDVETQSLVIQRGALFQGSCRMENLGEKKPEVLIANGKKKEA